MSATDPASHPAPRATPGARGPHAPPPGVKLRRVARSYPALRAIAALILREMSSRYGRSPGGYAWALLEPLGGILVLSFGFSLLLRAPPMGTSFLLFYASGMLPFLTYLSVTDATQRCINFSRALLFYPAVTWLDALLARFVLNALTGILVTFILILGIVIAIDAPVTLNLPPMVTAMALACGIALAMGTVNCVLMGLFPVWAQIWNIATKPLFIVSGILFLYEDLPAGVQVFMWWNPLLHIVALMRVGVYATDVPDYVSITYVIAVALVLLALGLMLMGRYHRDLLSNG